VNALVTGGSRGLGRALAAALVRRGWGVATVARGAAAVEGVIGNAGDVAADAERIAAEVQLRLGVVDLLIHNASTLGPVPLPPLLDVSPDELARVFAVNVFGPFALTRALVGPMVVRGAGTVVAISSDAAVNRYPTWGPYGASKAAQDHLIETLAAELADTGVSLHVFDPGEMDTEMHAAAMPDADRALLARPADVAERLLDRVLA
jgi:NAD(P)-dependent dehydrogenase (short-subunit alcohol dehydrogenase family)